MERILKYNQFINESDSIVDNLADQSKIASQLEDSIDSLQRIENDDAIINKVFGYNDNKPPIMSYLYLIYSDFLKKTGSSFVFPKETSPKNLWEKIPTQSKKTLNDIKNNFDLVKPGQIIIFQNSAGDSNAGIIFGTDKTKKEIYLFVRRSKSNATRIISISLNNKIRGVISFLGFKENSEFVDKFNSGYSDDIKTAKSLKLDADAQGLGGEKITEDGDSSSLAGGEGVQKSEFATKLGNAIDYFSKDNSTSNQD
jgi:hypothetical protein